MARPGASPSSPLLDGSSGNCGNPTNQEQLNLTILTDIEQKFLG